MKSLLKKEMEVLWSDCKSIVIGVGLMTAIKLFGWNITDDLTTTIKQKQTGEKKKNEK